MRRFARKGVIVTVVTAAVLGSAIAAYAYWTASGAGSGSATAAAGNAGFTASGNPANGLYPGGSVAVTTQIHNDDLNQKEWLTSFTVTTSIDSTHATAGCQASWFTYKADSDTSGSAQNPYTLTVGTEVAANSNYAVVGKVFMSDLATTDQSSCKGATINLAYAEV